MQPSSTRYLKPSVAFFADPFGRPRSACSTNSYGRSRTPDSTASSKAIRWILSKLPFGPSRHAPSQPILMGSMVSYIRYNLGGGVARRWLGVGSASVAVIGLGDALPSVPDARRQLRRGVRPLPGDLRRTARAADHGRGTRRRAAGN